MPPRLRPPAGRCHRGRFPPSAGPVGRPADSGLGFKGLGFRVSGLGFRV